MEFNFFRRPGINREQLIPRIRSLKPIRPLYMLLITSITVEDEDMLMSDDVLYQPYSARELKIRIAIDGSSISMAARLAMVQEQNESQAGFDFLTGFINKAGFQRQAAGELELSRRASVSLSLIALGIGDFRTIR